MSASKSVVVILLFLAFLVSCAPATAPPTGTLSPTEEAAPTQRATPTERAAPTATKSPVTPTRPPPTMAPIVARLHCPECAQEGKAIDLLDHERCDGSDGCLVVGQAQHGDQVHILTWKGGLSIEKYRVRVVETGLVGWVLPEYVVVP